MNIAQKDIQIFFWYLIIPKDNGQPHIKHGTKVKSNVVLSNGNWVDRNLIWIEFLYENPSSLIFDGVFGILNQNMFGNIQNLICQNPNH